MWKYSFPIWACSVEVCACLLLPREAMAAQAWPGSMVWQARTCSWENEAWPSRARDVFSQRVCAPVLLCRASCEVCVWDSGAVRSCRCLTIKSSTSKGLRHPRLPPLYPPSLLPPSAPVFWDTAPHWRRSEMGNDADLGLVIRGHRQVWRVKG